MFFIGILYFLLIIQVHYLGFYSSSLLGFLIPDSYSGSLSRFLEFLVFLVFLWLLISFLNQAGGLGSVLCSFCSSCKAVWKTVLPLCFPLCLPLIGITRSPARGYPPSKMWLNRIFQLLQLISQAEVKFTLWNILSLHKFYKNGDDKVTRKTLKNLMLFICYSFRW